MDLLIDDGVRDPLPWTALNMTTKFILKLNIQSNGFPISSPLLQNGVSKVDKEHLVFPIASDNQEDWMSGTGFQSTPKGFSSSGN